jgi:hypothetical protein
LPPHHLGEGAVEPLAVERPGETESLEQVVGGAPGLELVEEPEPLLGE